MTEPSFSFFLMGFSVITIVNAYIIPWNKKPICKSLQFLTISKSVKKFYIDRPGAIINNELNTKR